MGTVSTHCVHMNIFERRVYMEVRKQHWRLCSPNLVDPLNQIKVIWITNKCPLSVRCVISHVLISILCFSFSFSFSITKSLYVCEKQIK